MVEFFDPIAQRNISYHIDKQLTSIWDKIKEGKLEKKNEDRIYLCDGRERTGKSSFVFQQAKYINPYFDVDNICFTPTEFLHQIRTASKGSVIVFDEAFRGLSSKGSRSKINKDIVEALMEVGQRNLVIFIVLPTLFLLEMYAAVFRSEALFHIIKLKKESTEGIKQRAFVIYNYEKKKMLYLKGKQKYMSYGFPRIKKSRGRFFVKRSADFPVGNAYETFDLKSYLEKKEKAFMVRDDMGLTKQQTKWIKQRDLMIKYLYQTQIHSTRKLSKWLKEAGVDLNYTQIAEIIIKLKRESGENILEDEKDLIKHDNKEENTENS